MSQHKIRLGERQISYQVRRSQRARYLKLKIDVQGALEVIVPSGYDIDQQRIQSFLQQRQPWIDKHLGRIETARGGTLSGRRYVSGTVVPYLGEDHSLDVNPTHKAKRTTVARQACLLRIRLRSDVPDSETETEVRSALEKWYRQQARTYITDRVAALAGSHGFTYGRVTIRGQKTRWGSCSSKGNLNFNWRLMMAPPAAIDYVIIHEMCHLRELNHSKRFWSMVAAYCPDYEYWRQWLKANTLRLYL